MCCQVGRGRTQDTPDSNHLPGDRVVGRRLGMAQREVDVVVDQVHQLVGQDQLAFQFRVALGQARQKGRDIHAPECDRGTHAQ